MIALKPDYLLVASYNSAGCNAETFNEEFDDPDYTLDDVEAKIQLSIKFPLLVNIQYLRPYTRGSIHTLFTLGYLL